MLNLFIVNVTNYQVKMLLFYYVQTTNLALVDKMRRYIVKNYNIA